MTFFSGPRKRLVQGAFHHHLVTDHARVDAYARAVRAVVREGDVVADLGAGTGLLAGFAARAGARRVYAVEAEENARVFLDAFVTANDLEGVVTPVSADAEDWVPPEPVDVVVCEMMETGLMNEDQVAVMNRVHATWPKPPRAVLPFAATLTVSLVHAPEEHHGFRVLLPHFERDPPPHPFTRLTARAAYHRADFREPGPRFVDATVPLEGAREGRANAALLETTTHLADGVDAEGSPDHASPLVLPLDAPVDVAPGQRFETRVAYALGSVTGRVDVAVTTRA